MPSEGPSASSALHAGDRRWQRFVGFLGRHDLFYVVPTAIAVAAFIVAMLAYFGRLSP
jgi:hypothetical protein